jgi:hypothetical protein
MKKERDEERERRDEEEEREKTVILNLLLIFLHSFFSFVSSLTPRLLYSRAGRAPLSLSVCLSLSPE